MEFTIYSKSHCPPCAFILARALLGKPLDLAIFLALGPGFTTVVVAYAVTPGTRATFLVCISLSTVSLLAGFVFSFRDQAHRDDGPKEFSATFFAVLRFLA
uniref:(northern house mosquito) hypothetical protein n=1 Tax=Culex pipiens TaxID=7175 RepID=A0A8D8DB30_CULPI